MNAVTPAVVGGIGSELTIIAEALAFYSQTENYDDDAGYGEASLIVYDQGAKAKSALAALDTLSRTLFSNHNGLGLSDDAEPQEGVGRDGASRTGQTP